MGSRKISGLTTFDFLAVRTIGILFLLFAVNHSFSQESEEVVNINHKLLSEDLKRCKSDPASWELLGPTSIDFHNMGLVDEVLYNPEIEGDFILSPNHGGIWKNRPTGNSWENVSDPMNLPGISASEMIRNPFNNNHIIASTETGEWGINYGYGIIESFDNGNSWQVMDGFPNNLYTQVKRVIFDPYDLVSADGLTLFAITKTKIYKSENTGLSWTEIENGPIELYEILHNEYIDIEIDNHGDIYLTTLHIYGFNGQVFKSNNNEWLNLNPGYSNFDSIQRARITKPVEGKIFLLGDTQHDGRQIFKSYDYGATWEYMRNTPNNGWKNEIEYSPESNIVYVGGINIRVFYDEAPYPLDTIFPLHVDIRDFEIMNIDSAGYEHVLTATDGGVLLIKTNIHNISDYQQEDLNGNHLPIGNFIGMSVTNNNEEKIIGGTVHCRSFVYENNTWDDFGGGKRGGDGGDCELNWQNPSLLYYQNNEFFVRRMDTIEDTIYDVEDWFIGMKFELNPNNPDIVYMGRKGKLLIYDEISDSLEIKMIPQETGSAGALGINNKNEIFLTAFGGLRYNMENRFIKSNDNGNSWEDLSKNPITDSYSNTTELRLALNYKQIMDILFNPDNPEELWICGGGILVDWSDKSSKLNYPGKYRVMHSVDGGENWADYSKGLTALPAVALEYQLGSNNRIFVGTDAGVYYREPGMAQWELFSEGLPFGLISDLDYEPCSGFLYASIDSRGIWKTSVNFETDTIFILEGETVWDYTKRLSADLIISEGAKLLVKSEIYMPKGKKIIVQPGGHLILDGGKITNTCGGMWHGIEVLGNLNYGADTAKQGYVSIKNNSTIENSKFGIYAYKLIYENGEWLIDANYVGGIIQAENSNLINNQTTIHLYNVARDNINYLHNCHFETNDNYLGELNPQSFIELRFVMGFDIFNCSFINNSENEYLHSGITAFSSHFCVNGKFPESTEAGRFENLDYGIYATNYNPGWFPDIQNNQFINNYRGVYFGDIAWPILKSNYFYLAKKAETKSYGAYFDQSRGYIAEENCFEGDSTSGQTGIGIIVNQSGDTPNEIKLNQFSNLEYGMNIQGINRSFGNPHRGLALKCNEYTGCLFSQTVLPENIFDIKANEGIAASQGFFSENISDFAGNIFINAENFQFNLYNEANHFDYSIPSDSHFPMIPDEFTNHSININTETINNSWVFENECIPTVFPQSNKEIQLIWEKLEDIESKALEDYMDYISKINNGETMALLDKVWNSSTSNAPEVYSDLYIISPWLSEYIIKDFIENDVFTNAMVREIMVANPDASKYRIIMEALEEKRSDMPNYMMAQILERRNYKSLKQLLETELARWEMEKTNAKKILRIYYTNNPDSLEKLSPSLLESMGFSELEWLKIKEGNPEERNNIFKHQDIINNDEPVLFPNISFTELESEKYENILSEKTNNNLLVYPNPASHYVTIEYLLDPNDFGTIEIKDIFGKNVSSATLSGLGHTTVFLDSWISGLYFVNLKINDKDVISTKFLITN